MGRENKFRGIRVDNKDWVYGYLFISRMSGCFILNSKIHTQKKRSGGVTIGDKLEQYEVIPETVGEFTGLKDRKRTEEFPEGQEVYEGDKITCRQYIGGNFVEYAYEKGYVGFKNGAFYLVREQGFYRTLDWLVEMDYEIEVTGNIKEAT